MQKQPYITFGAKYQDERGILSFVNDFDMSAVKRFYKIRHADIITKRGWRAHQIEQRWFHITEGAFLINVIAIDNWTTPNKCVEQLSFEIHAKDNAVLHVPNGHATCIMALTENAEMIIFADETIDRAHLDDHLFPSDYFINLKNSKK